MTDPTDPQAELREQIEKALHVDWAFKNKNTKPDKIVILGYPKECGYYLSYEDFVGRVVELLTTERERVIGEVLETINDTPVEGMSGDQILIGRAMTKTYKAYKEAIEALKKGK